MTQKAYIEYLKTQGIDGDKLYRTDREQFKKDYIAWRSEKQPELPFVPPVGIIEEEAEEDIESMAHEDDVVDAMVEASEDEYMPDLN